MSEVAPRQALIEKTILWEGGSDTYLVDLNEAIDAPETVSRPDWWKHHVDRTVHTSDGEWWLLCRALNHDWYNDKILSPDPKRGSGVHPDTKMVRIVRRLRGGD